MVFVFVGKQNVYCLFQFFHQIGGTDEGDRHRERVKYFSFDYVFNSSDKWDGSYVSQEQVTILLCVCKVQYNMYQFSCPFCSLHAIKVLYIENALMTSMLHFVVLLIMIAKICRADGESGKVSWKVRL